MSGVPGASPRRLRISPAARMAANSFRRSSGDKRAVAAGFGHATKALGMVGSLKFANLPSGRIGSPEACPKHFSGQRLSQNSR